MLIGWKDKWLNTWNYEKKIKYLLYMVIALLTVAAIGASVGSSLIFITKQNKDYASEQLEAMTTEYSGILEQYKRAMLSLCMNESIQVYCTYKDRPQMTGESGIAYTAIVDALYAQNNANFVAVRNDSTHTFLYTGQNSISASSFETAYETDMKQSIQAKDQGTLRISYAKNYYHGLKYTLTLYFPVYSIRTIAKPNGMLVMNVDDSLLEHLSNNQQFNRLCLVDKTGIILSNEDQNKNGTKLQYGEQLTGKSGSLWVKGTLVNYQRIDNWNYYLVSEVPTSYLYSNSIRIAVILLVVMFSVMIISTFVSRKVAKDMYRPINRIIAQMKEVSENNLYHRFDTKHMDSDSKKLAEGYNVMMDEIDVLMQKVTEEQQILAQMKLNFLQSQIQPHFLYNTLECIHWQALADGSTTASTMVKALAQYYRLCLSEGKDLIPLKQELEHVKNYLLIQNMRYDHIIQLEIQMDPRFDDVMIPKVTLQPLVENSIYHGIRVKDGKRGRVWISISEEEQGILITVEDDGQGMEEAQIAQINRTIHDVNREASYGITNVNQRIELLYGREYGLRYFMGKEQGVKAVITLPRKADHYIPGENKQIEDKGKSEEREKQDV